jgi:hypothetical protein
VGTGRRLAGDKGSSRPPVTTRAAISSRTVFTPRRSPVSARATVATRAAVKAGAAPGVRESRFRRPPEDQGAFYVARAAAVQPVEDALSILPAKRIQQFIGTKHTHVDAGLTFSEQISHRPRELQIVNNGSRSPLTGPSNRAYLPPPPHDDNEIASAKDRARNSRTPYRRTSERRKRRMPSFQAFSTRSR